MGLGAEWKQRWVVVMPRYQLPNQHSGSQQRVARSLLVCYRSRDQCEPVCKVWLDGAVARSVTGSLGSGFLQCALVSAQHTLLYLQETLLEKAEKMITASHTKL